uniref:Uncharacterized protein n=1 Tax=Brassica oleracea TaxID=3712 RepID=A0A3P6AQ65_BRAOL|nr:unnamed protein product [Brassica oleracea]
MQQPKRLGMKKPSEHQIERQKKQKSPESEPAKAMVKKPSSPGDKSRRRRCYGRHRFPEAKPDVQRRS